MVSPSYEEACKVGLGYQLIPVSKEVYGDTVTPILLLRKLSQINKRYYLLESVEGGERLGRYSFLGYQPLLRVYSRQGKAFIERGKTTKEEVSPPMEVLRNLLIQYKAPHIDGMPTFSGGFVGYFSYEMIGYAEPKLKLKENEFNDYDLMLFDKVIVYDHLKQKIKIIVNYQLNKGEEGYQLALLEIEKMEHFIFEEMNNIPMTYWNTPVFGCNTSKDEYCKMVNKIKEYIREGDIFQAVISRRFEAECEGSLLDAYRVLRTTNPSPYMYFISCDDIEIAGTSPETMVKLEGVNITTFPVAGTRRRGSNEEEDKALERELLNDEKELAEHNMLVDLARNDIGKIARYRSVQVDEYKNVHRFSKVMHIASVVRGVIKEDKDGLDTILALLPAGTLSGAPKFRACEIINELEPVARGIYGGAIGYLDLSGNLDVCIAIRTAVKKGNKVYVQAGAGIVADSIPNNEYEETGNKACAVIEAICNAGEVSGL